MTERTLTLTLPSRIQLGVSPSDVRDWSLCYGSLDCLGEAKPSASQTDAGVLRWSPASWELTPTRLTGQRLCHNLACLPCRLLATASCGAFALAYALKPPHTPEHSPGRRPCESPGSWKRAWPQCSLYYYITLTPGRISRLESLCQPKPLRPSCHFR